MRRDEERRFADSRRATQQAKWEESEMLDAIADLQSGREKRLT